RATVHEVALHRVIRADECLRLAQRLYDQSKDEETLRAVTGRAYYSIHHSLRAMVLYEKDYDPDGHQASIDALADLILKDSGFRARSGLDLNAAKDISKAKDNREIADYSPFDASRAPNGASKIKLSHRGWLETAKFNLDLAERLVVASIKVVG